MAEKRVDLVYDELGQRASLTRYADSEGTKYVAGTDYVFDALGRLTTLKHGRADGVFAESCRSGNSVPDVVRQQSCQARSA